MTRLALCLAGLLALGPAAGTAWAIKGVDFPSHTMDEVNTTLDQGDFATAVTMLEEILRFEPNDPEVHNLLGYSKRHLGDLEGAMASYVKALEINPDHKGTLEYQGELFLKLNDQAAAEKNLARLKELCPQGCEAHDTLQAAIERFKDGGEFAWTGKRVASN
jgi:Flp pilus assembly protein TadD